MPVKITGAINTKFKLPPNARGPNFKRFEFKTSKRDPCYFCLEDGPWI